MNKQKNSAELDSLTDILQEMSRLKSSQGRNNNTGETQILMKYYLEKVQGLGDQDEIDSQQAMQAFEDLLSKVQILQSEYEKLSKSQRGSAGGNASEIPKTLNQMLKIQKSVVLIQAWWRKELTIKKLERDLRLSKSSLSARKSHQTPEESAMKEFTNQLKAKKLTPESFFRICDTDYSQRVTVAQFKERLLSLNVQLSKAQMSRLIMILDEDIEGTITLEEYTHALEAYGCSGERHKPLDGSLLHHSFEHKCLFKLITELQRKDITFLEVYAACDINDDKRVSISEVRNFVEGLSPDFKQKEIHALMSYIDIDNNGWIDKDEFLRQMSKGEQNIRQTQYLNKQISDKRVMQRAVENQQKASISSGFNTIQQQEDDSFIRFEQEDIGAGDQAFGPEPTSNMMLSNSSNSTLPKSRQNNFTQGQSARGITQETTSEITPDMLKRKQIIERMEREGLSLTNFIEGLKRYVTNNLIALGTLLKQFELSYPSISVTDRSFLVKDCLRDRTKIDFLLFQDLLAKFSKNLKPSVTSFFQTLMANILKKMGTSPQDSLKQFFRANSLTEVDVISEIEFTQIFEKMMGTSVDKATYSQAFKTLNLDADGFVLVKDLIDVLISYVSLSSGSAKISTNLSSDELKRLIPGIDTMSPRARSQNIVTHFTKELNLKNMKALSVFKMADTANTGITSIGNLETAFRKIFPNYKYEIIQELMQAFKTNENKESVTREDFETLFQEETAKGKQAQPDAKPKVDETEAARWINNLSLAFQREGVTPAIAFKNADADHNGIVTVNELRDAIKRLVPEESISLLDLKKVLIAFDTNKNGKIEEQEFIEQFAKAKNNPDAKPSASQYEDKKSQMPIKENNPVTNVKTQEQAQTGSDQSLTLIINELDDKVNLKKLLADVPINEDGKILVPHLSRRLKSETAIKASDYMPLIKSLDSASLGSIEVKAMIKLLEKHLKTYTLDCTLEIKYIANFLEFNKSNRNTKGFLETNTKLSSQAPRLLEIDLMTELNKAFDIPIQLGATIYKLLKTRKGDINFKLDDLCALIDEQRLVKIEPQKPIVPSESSKLSPELIIKDLKQKFSALPKRIQTEISQKLKAIDDQQKQIPYPDFYGIFADEKEGNMLLTSAESKAVYMHIKQLSNNLFNFALLQQFGIIPKDQQTPYQPPKVEKIVNPGEKQPEPAPVQIDINLLVKTIEGQLKQPIENAIEDILMQDDVILVLQFHRKLTQIAGTLDKKQLTALTQAISNKPTGKLEVREIVTFLSKVPGKYSQDAVLAALAKEIPDPLEKSFADANFIPSDHYQKQDYLGVIQIVSSTVSVFHALALFYNLCSAEQEISGKILIDKLKAIPKQTKSKGSTKQHSQESAEEMMKGFVSKYSIISTDSSVQSSLKKFSDAIKQNFKTIGDAKARFDPTGKGSIFVDEFSRQLDELAGFSDNEVLVLSFIPVDPSEGSDLSVMSISNYFYLLFTAREITPALVNKYKTQLQLVFDALKRKYQPTPSQQTNLSPNKPKPLIEEEEKSSPAAKDSPPLKIGIQRLDTYAEQRFQKLIPLMTSLKPHLADNAKKTALLSMFEKADQQSLQVDVIFGHIAKHWGVKASITEMDFFEKEVDYQEKGRIELVDVIRFCKLHGIDLKFTGVLRQTTKEQEQIKYRGQGELLSCGDLEYEVVPERDFYNGIPTILKSEEAALVAAEKIFKNLGENEQFFDQDFGPKNDDDLEGSSKSLYYTGVPPTGCPDPESIQWMRPEDYNNEMPVFINDGASANDVKQGILGNCWFISALSVLATRDELLSGRIGSLDLEQTAQMMNFKANASHALDFSKGVYPGLFHIYRMKGLYIFRFFKNFQWVYVLVDDRLPCRDKYPVFGTCKDPLETWVPLIEKAYAKLHGCYEALNSGFIDDALSELTGFVAEKVLLHDKAGKFPNKGIGTPDQFWDFIKKRVSEKCLMGCSRSNAGEAEVIINGERTGIIAGHAYGLMDAFEISDHLSPGETIRLLRLRNPWGRREWRGQWSDTSEEINIYKDQLDQYIANLNDDDEKFVPGEEDGTFLINYEDWSSIYTNMFICVDFPENWNGIRYKSQWETTCAGGLPNPLDEKTRLRWAKNPQFCIENHNQQEMEIFISLAQPDGRGQKNVDGEAIKFPYSEVIHNIVFTVLHQPFPLNFSNKEGFTRPPKLERFDEKCVKKVSVVKPHKEVSVRLTVPEGYIYIVPSTAEPGKLGPFILSFYFNQSKSLLHFNRLDKSENRYDIIKEESENANNVPAWKIALCDKRIKFMIFEDDEGLDDLKLSATAKTVNASSQRMTVKAVSQGGAIKLSSAANKKLGKAPPKAGGNSSPARNQNSPQKNEFDSFIGQK